MKKLLLSFGGASFILLSLCLVSCGDQRVINRTARTFLQSFYVDHNFEAAKAVSTRMTHDNIDTRAMMLLLNPNFKANRFNSFEIDKKEIRNTKAVVFYTLNDEVERQLNLSLIDRVWLVDMPEQTTTNPVLSLSLMRGGGGFASAVSEPIRLRDVPSYDPQKKEREEREERERETSN